MDKRLQKEPPRTKRGQVFEAHGPHCYYCGVELVVAEVAWSPVDHYIPKSAGGTNDLDNLVPACRSCNSSKGGRLPEEFRLTLTRRLAGMPRFTPEQTRFLLGEFGLDLEQWLRDNLVEFYGERQRKETLEALHEGLASNRLPVWYT